MRCLHYAFCCWLLLPALATHAQKKQPAANPVGAGKETSIATLVNGLQFRSVGPAITSGRVADLAVNPVNNSEYYVAAASGGVWKTTNAGTTFSPVFDDAGAYSIGCLAMDPANTNVVWVGTGEHNNQRSVAYGDGVYKTSDGGRSWQHMGLKASEHIGRIAIDPTNPDIVYVAAYGPLWRSGGERGVYKTTDGGKSWKRVLHVSEHTGFNEVMVDPRHPNIVYAAAHQRQRKVYTYVGGGPESALYKSTDGGNSWSKMTAGLPSGDLGRIGLNYSPANPDVLYAIVEAADGKGGIYRSNDRGASWEQRSPYTTAGNYYQRVFCDPKDVEKIFLINTYMGVSTDGGRTVAVLGERNKHIDNHVIWIDPQHTSHYIVGCDGGLYESFNSGAEWQFKPNLPITQFYKVSTDNATPFYNIVGGTQDNFSLGGPSRTTSANGIMNADWFFTALGDGFESQVDPTDPNTIYAQAQYGYLVRYDKKTGERLYIQPTPEAGESADRWNWDAPLLLSQFDNRRLYFASNKVYRTDDRGNTWKRISADLSRQLDRNKLPVMGKVWSVDAIAKNQSTDIWGNITTLAESKFDENLLYAGTDDGLIQVTGNGGQSWTKVDNIPGVPELTYVNQIVASLHDPQTAYVAFNHHRDGDFHPYLYRTRDGGRTWTAIQGNLPERGSVYSIAEDHVDPNLLFAGTEFGVFVTVDGGKEWVPMKGGLPTIAVRDMEIQRRENDLVLATFGRGFYVLDDYTPLRYFKKEQLDRPAAIFPVKTAQMFIEATPLGVRGKGFQGESFFTAPNPKPGAVFTYFLKEDLKTLKDKRRELEKERYAKSQLVYYPSLDSLRAEDQQPAPHLLFTIADEQGNTVRRIKAPARKGVHRISWDFRYAPFEPVELTPFDASDVFNWPPVGYMALPGNYTVSLSKFEDGVLTELVPAEHFKTVPLNAVALPEAERKALTDFHKQLAELLRVVSAANAYQAELNSKLRYMRQALVDAPKLPVATVTNLHQLEQRLLGVNTRLNGDAAAARREFEVLPSITNRIYSIIGTLWSSTAAPTQTFVSSYRQAAAQFTPVYLELKAIGAEVEKLEIQLEKSNAPYTPGRMPEWKHTGN